MDSLTLYNADITTQLLIDDSEEELYMFDLQSVLSELTAAEIKAVIND